MTTTPILENNVLHIQIASDLSIAGSVLSRLQKQGVQVLRWSVASTDDAAQSRLTVEYQGKRETVSATLLQADEVVAFEMPELQESVQIELALVRVRASGKPLDEAAEIVGAAGGRLLSLSSEGFSAQVSSRPEKIEAMLSHLSRTAPTEVVRSGRLSVQK